MTTRTIRLADARGGMNSQAAILLHALSLEDIEVPDSFYITTGPYCNCREMGFVISINHPGAKAPTNLAFYEHRNSDSLCALRGEGFGDISGVWLPDHFPGVKDKWQTTRDWPYLSINKAIEYVREVLAELMLLSAP